MQGETTIILSDESMREIVLAHFKNVLFRDGKVSEVKKIVAIPRAADGGKTSYDYQIIFVSPPAFVPPPTLATPTHDQPKSNEGYFNQQ